MTSLSAQTFTGALQEAEQTRDVQPLVELFRQDCTLSNLSTGQPETGHAGAKAFWERYLSVFQEIRSEFTHVVETEKGVVLEWESAGKLANGEAVRYRGVSILEVLEGKIKAFRTYYDSAAFTPGGGKNE